MAGVDAVLMGKWYTARPVQAELCTVVPFFKPLYRDRLRKNAM
jgi:hypothetical protein